jgi:hypothetical protein
MGGDGSGRPRLRGVTSSYLQLDIRPWQRERRITTGQSFEWQWLQDNQVIASIYVHPNPNRFIFEYCRCDGERVQESFRYLVSVAWTTCNYGGRRAWFICPVSGCGKRVAILYLNGVFACRKCCQLVYDSQRRTAWERALTRAQRIRMSLGADGNLSEPFPARPRGMHWRTYDRLRRAEEAANAQSWPPWLLVGVRTPLSGSHLEFSTQMYKRLMDFCRGES